MIDRRTFLVSSIGLIGFFAVPCMASADDLSGADSCHGLSSLAETLRGIEAS